MKDLSKMTDYERDIYFQPSDWTLTVFKVVVLSGISLLLWGLIYGMVVMALAIGARFVLG